MRLDEALLYRWAGRDIKRRCWTGTLNSITKNLDAGYLVYNLSNEDIDADDWEVVPKYVGWDEAWKATKQGKAFISDYYNMENSRMERREFKLNKTTHVLEYMDKYGYWRIYDKSVPLHWLDATNFEILED